MIPGITLAVIAGFLGGTALLPLRYTTKWSFESTWFFWSIFSYLILPSIIVICFVPHFLAVFQEVGLKLFMLVLFSGIVSGTGGFLMGFSTSKIGIASSNAIANGLALALGSIIPLIFQHKVLSLAGVFIFAYASHYNSKTDSSARPGAIQKSSGGTMIGLVAAFVAGLLTPTMNLGIAFADDFMKVAAKYGTSESFMTFAFYLPLFFGSFITNIAYTVIMWYRKGTFREIANADNKKIIIIALAMALIFMISNLAYGWAMPHMQGYGPVLGWPIYLTLCNIGAVIVECILGDWKGKALKVLLLGILVLTLAIAIFAFCSMKFN
jgi:L-rhamnose-H+ transport protein